MSIDPPQDVKAQIRKEIDRKFRLEEMQAKVLQDIAIEEENVNPHEPMMR